MDDSTQKLKKLGFDDFWQPSREELSLENFQLARVVSQVKEGYRVRNINGDHLAKLTGKHIFNATSSDDFPAVGDWVAITELGNNQAVISNLLPRKSLIKRIYGDKNRSGIKDRAQVIAANINLAFVVEAVGRDYNLNRIERYFSIIQNGGVQPAVILNKIDLVTQADTEEKITQLKNRFPKIDIIATSNMENNSLEKLKKHLSAGKTYCFLGSSGVGKSSLINRLIGEKLIKTAETGSRSNRGKHTTTARQTYFLENGAIVIDNPGIREVGSTESGSETNSSFDEISRLSRECKFSDCTHTNEPGCQIIHALKTGQLDQEKYSNFLVLKKESDYYQMTANQKRAKKRQFGKFVNQAKKDLKKFGHKY